MGDAKWATHDHEVPELVGLALLQSDGSVRLHDLSEVADKLVEGVVGEGSLANADDHGLGDAL